MAVCEGRCVGDGWRRHLLHRGRRLAPPAHAAQFEQGAPTAEGADVGPSDAAASPSSYEVGATAAGGGGTA